MGTVVPLNRMTAMGDLEGSEAGRMLQVIRRDMDLKGELFKNRRRNEEILALSYQDGTTLGGATDWQNIRENSLNIPYRHNRWLEARATSKKMIVKVNRDAGEGQRPGGPADDKVGMWTGITLGRVAHIGGFRREMNAVIGEVEGRGVSVMKIGYHHEEITLAQTGEVGKNAQSVVPEVLDGGDTEAKPGQDHPEISKGLAAMAEDEMFQLAAGSEGVDAVLARKDSHDDAALKDETDDSPIQNTRLIRRRVYMRKLRVGEDVGWAPWVYDVEDTPFWWERFVWTVAEVKAAKHLFKRSFRRMVEGYDGRNVSEVFRSGKTPSTDSMGMDARQAQSEDVLTEDERFVEWFALWYRRPDMQAGGYRKIVAPEMPDEFVEADDSNPHYDETTGTMMIPDFYPFYEFAPILSSLTVPERTCAIPLIGASMPHFEKLAEYNRIRQEAALKGVTRISQFHPALKDNKQVIAAVENGEIFYGFISPDGLVGTDGKMLDAVKNYDFSNSDPEIDRQAAKEELNCLNMLGMPPSAYQGMGTAKTATQDAQGISASEGEADAVISYMETRMADVLCGMRGLIRGNYDDEDFQKLLGQEGAAVMKQWQTGTVDDGDEIIVTFGANAKAQEVVEKKQLMEAIALVRSAVEPLSGQPIYDEFVLIEELFRRLNVGAPKKSEAPFKALHQLVKQLAAKVEELTGENPLDQKGKQNGKPKGPNPSEGAGPTQQNLGAGAARGAAPQDAAPVAAQ